MTPMAALATMRLAHRRTPGRLPMLDQPLFQAGALALGLGELLGDKMKSAPNRTVALGLVARTLSAGIAGAALAPRGREREGAAVSIVIALPLAYLTLAARRHAIGRFGQSRSGLIEDVLVVAAGFSVVAAATRRP